MRLNIKKDIVIDYYMGRKTWMTLSAQICDCIEKIIINDTVLVDY
ncbi:MAG: hypothetical protein ACFC03_02540 [Candidatus Malihini olakiniferum]